jgi:hypothetical protein
MNVGVSFSVRKLFPENYLCTGVLDALRLTPDVGWHHNIKWISLALNNNT